ncbi:head maturation protease, ClpP-related [Riemerella columbipharyngis]|uniref:ATP-dependent Clp protease proteolytic subunit n=1 Tax=Riemerella columbipharyngis TaxID=1071918 RepID=A0A1G7FIN9_9FLAO|nr:head maturation protease, ClpP-related [Riemerella columbipharyngis]SDE75773.1 ATP-dependent Clp endopeptidase, proteolytic subunit ClpP [Riemerella columbipharyngis]
MIFSTDKNELKCYGRIFPGDGVSFMYYFENLQKTYNEITIRLHTYGGSVIDGNLIFNAINQSPSKVKIIVDGLAASMGAIILTATTDVAIAENGYIMVHAPSGYAEGTAADLKGLAKLLEAMEANFIAKLVQRTAKPQKEIQNLMQGDNWFDADEALKMGLVSEIIPSNNTTLIPIEEPTALGELEVFNAYASLMISGDTTEINQLNTDTNMKQLLITAFSLAVVTAESSDTAVLEALKGKFKELEDEKDKAIKDKADAEASLSTFKEEQINAVIEAHAKTFSLTDEKKDIFRKIGKTSGVDALMAVLDNQPQASPNISEIIQKGKSDAARASWTWDEWQSKDPRGLEALAVSDKETYQKLFNEKYKK